MNFPVETLQQLLDSWGYLIVFGFVAIESTGIPFPGETMLIVAAVYAGLGSISILGVIVSAALGAIFGDSLGYWIGRKGGYPLLQKYGKYIFIDQPKMDWAKRYYHKHGDKTVFLGRFVAVLRAWSAFLAGVNQMPWPKFLLFNASGGIVWATTFGLLGFYLSNNIEFLHRLIQKLGIISVIILIILLGLVYITWKRRKDN